jgi:biopolymer transport protein ExbB
MWLAWWRDADWVVRAIFLLLVGLSVASWTIILFKSWELARVDRQERRTALAGGGPGAQGAGASFSARAVGRALAAAGVAATGEAGRLVLREHLEQALAQERLQLESQLTLLASIGTSAPFIGLLGTVWGIMHALGSLQGADAFGLDQVAGPVGEALVATAAGLFTAIPAVVAYNLLVRRLRRIGTLMGGNALRLVDGNLGGAPGPGRPVPGAGDPG